MSLTFCLVIAWYGWRYFHEALTGGWRTETVWSLPLWDSVGAAVAGMGLLSLQWHVADILCLVTDAVPFGMDPEAGE